MAIRELRVADAYEFTPRQFPDSRGAFLEWYRADEFAAAVGHPLDLRQGNMSISRRGVLRGVHFADVPPGQAKYVTCPAGAVLDFVVDIRVGSPTFGEWDTVLLDDVDRRSVYLAEGLGHAFLALSDGATVSYLVSSAFDAQREHGITPLDPELGLPFAERVADPVLSDKDRAAPTLQEAADTGLLPSWAQLRTFYQAQSQAQGDGQSDGETP